MALAYDSLLGLCGYSPEDLARERPRLDKVFERIGLDGADIAHAEDWVRTQHDIALKGVRLLLRAWLLELCDAVLARDEGKKVIYYGFPSIQGPGMAIKSAAEIPVYVGCPDVVICHTLGQIFNKLTPILEAAEQRGLPPGHGLCSLQQIRNGSLALGIIPVPDLVTGSSYYCDMGSKADELLHEIYGHRAIYVDGCMDSAWGEFPGYDPARLEFLASQIDKLFATVKECFGIEVTARSQEKAMATSRQLFSNLGRLTRLMQADPMPVSGVASGLALQLSAASTGRSMTEGPQAVAVLCDEVEERVKSGFGVVPKGAPRVLSFIQPFSDPSITHMMEESGLALSASILTVPCRKREAGMEFASLGEERAEWAMRDGNYHSLFALAQRFADAAAELKVDGVIWGYLYNCRPLALGSHLLPQYVEKQTGIPAMALEIDIYDSRNYSAASLKTRVESFAEMLWMRKVDSSQAPAGTSRK